MNATSTPTVSLPAVRKIVKAAGVDAATVRASTQVKGYSNVTHQGFQLRKETTYGRLPLEYPGAKQRKGHTPTGRVVFSLLLSSWHADEAKAEQDVQTVREALTAAGYTVTAKDGASRQLIIGA
jgi:hypothetical protein